MKIKYLVLAFALLQSTSAFAVNASAPEMSDAYFYCEDGHGINVKWKSFSFANGNPVKYYKIYRDGQILEPKFVPVSNAITQKFRDSSVAVGSTHSYTVSAVDAAGTESNQSIRGSSYQRDCSKVQPKIGTIRVGFLLVNDNPSGKPYDLPRSTALKALAKVDKIYQQASWGQASVVGDVYGPFESGPVPHTCSLDTLVAEGIRQANISATQYDYYILIGANRSCSNFGDSRIGAYVYFTSTIPHELGHAMRLHHASASGCSIASLTNNTCKSKKVEYYNRSYDFMSHTTEFPETNGPHKEQLGWLNFNGVSQIKYVEQDGVYALSALDLAPKANENLPKLLKIISGSSNPGAYKTPAHINIEFRKGFKGIIVNHTPIKNLASRTLNEPQTVQVTSSGPIVRPGKTIKFSKDSSQVTVKVLSVSSNEAQVEVTFD